MANSYTSVPNIIPGNLQVQGNLTVKGANFILGQLARKYRIQEIANGQFVETVNLDQLAHAQDDPASVSETRQIWPTGTQFAIGTEAAGQPNTTTWLLVTAPNSLQVAASELRLGPSAPFARCIRGGSGEAAITSNLGADLVSRDETSSPATYFEVAPFTPQISAQLLNAAGAQMNCSPALTFWTDYVVHTVTGTTVATVVSAKTVRSNLMSPNSALLITIIGNVATVTGGGINLFINLPAANLGFGTIPASTTGYFRASGIFANQNANNVQSFNSMLNYVNYSGVGQLTSVAQNTSVDFPIQMEVQPTLATDSVTVWGIIGQLLNTSGPL